MRLLKQQQPHTKKISLIFKHDCGHVMIWGDLSFNGVGEMTHRKKKYVIKEKSDFFFQLNFFILSFFHYCVITKILAIFIKKSADYFK